jgi:hypothetical protein
MTNSASRLIEDEDGPRGVGASEGMDEPFFPWQAHGTLH